MQTVGGRVLDKLGTKLGLSLAVLWYSVAAIATAGASGLKSFAVFRFLLGTGEAANWPGATKTVSEWFPKSERGLAVAIFDSGSAIGGALAPFIVLWIYHSFGTWRPAFIITGALGFIWLLVWRAVYHPPETHPRLSAQERELILSDRKEERMAEGGSMSALLKQKPTWGIILGKSLTDPVWFFITDWFAIFLVSKGFRLENTLMGFWVPFLAADFGNFFGGILSGWLIKRGWSVLAARKFVILICGIGMATLIPAVFASSLWPIVTLFAISTFSYAAWSTMALALPSDLYPTHSVATVSGMSGTGAGIGTIISTFLIGRIADQYSFEPVLIGASLIPLVATALVFLLVREHKPASA
jgi:ACS family hexuronate transporter-like MFS transporter